MNNPKDMLVSDEHKPCGEKIMCHCGGCIAFDMDPEDPEWVDSKARYKAVGKLVAPAYKGDVMDGCHCGEVIAKLRSERDELVGALRATWNALEASPCDPDITVDQIAAHAEMNKHNVPELLAKHKPE